MEINDKVYQLMAKHRYNQADLARMTGIHPSLVSKLLKNQRRWNMDQITAVAKALEVTPAYLLSSGENNSKACSSAGTKSKSLSEQVEEAITEAEKESLEQDIKPVRSTLFKRLFEHCGMTGDSPSPKLVKRFLPFLV